MALVVAVGTRSQDVDLGGPSQLGDLVPGWRMGVVGAVWADYDEDV